jgi:cation:H+ antiporter
VLLHLLILLLSFAIILAGSELFTNGVEWAGHRLGVAEAAVGSLMAAVGTALPETLIPAVALLTGRDDPTAHSAVGVGAIIGAPLMLSTIALCVMGLAALGYRRHRMQVALRVSPADVRRDLGFFIPIFMALLAIGAIPTASAVRHIVAAGLLAIYAWYSFVMLRLKRADNVELDHGLYFERIFRGDRHAPRSMVTALQVLAGALAILVGAIEFVDQIILFSHHAKLNPGVLALILSPLATELPEKYNSVVWIRQRKDHLAMANITGAMVFQSCIPVALGLAYSPWRLSPAEMIGGAVTLASSGLLFFNVADGEVGTPTLMLGGAAYAVFLLALAWLGTF